MLAEQRREVAVVVVVVTSKRKQLAMPFVRWSTEHILSMHFMMRTTTRVGSDADFGTVEDPAVQTNDPTSALTLLRTSCLPPHAESSASALSWTSIVSTHRGARRASRKLAEHEPRFDQMFQAIQGKAAALISSWLGCRLNARLAACSE